MSFRDALKKIAGLSADIPGAEACLLLNGPEEFDAAIRLAPENDNYRWDRSIILLHLGRWEEGWRTFASAPVKE